MKPLPTKPSGLGHVGHCKRALLHSAGHVLLMKTNDLALSEPCETLTTRKTCKTQVASQSMHCETSVFYVCFDHAHGPIGKGNFPCSFWSTPIDVFVFIVRPVRKIVRQLPVSNSISRQYVLRTVVLILMAPCISSAPTGNPIFRSGSWVLACCNLILLISRPSRIFC